MAYRNTAMAYLNTAMLLLIDSCMLLCAFSVNSSVLLRWVLRCQALLPYVSLLRCFVRQPRHFGPSSRFFLPWISLWFGSVKCATKLYRFFLHFLYFPFLFLLSIPHLSILYWLIELHLTLLKLDDAFFEHLNRIPRHIFNTTSLDFTPCENALV